MVLGDTAGATSSRISSLDATTASTMRQSRRVSVFDGRPEPNLWVWECSTDHCSKQRHTTDTTCAAIRPASRRPTVRPRSNSLRGGDF